MADDRLRSLASSADPSATDADAKKVVHSTRYHHHHRHHRRSQSLLPPFPCVAKRLSRMSSSMFHRVSRSATNAENNTSTSRVKKEPGTRPVRKKPAPQPVQVAGIFSQGLGTSGTRPAGAAGASMRMGRVEYASSGAVKNENRTHNAPVPIYAKLDDDPAGDDDNPKSGFHPLSVDIVAAPSPTAEAKVEDGNEADNAAAAEEEKETQTPFLFQLPPLFPVIQPPDLAQPGARCGQVGEVVVRRSGRVQLRIGDVFFNLNRGTDIQFLQQVMVVDSESKCVLNLGKVNKKMVVVPDILQLLSCK